MNVGSRPLGRARRRRGRLGVRDRRRARNGVPTRPRLHALQQARGTEACNRINNRYRLPLEDPAGHSIAQRRVANVDYLHMSPQNF